jgi:2-amino-4-hydroxy-6-hydroxymethyldihydropteridine diphosphokinase
LFKPPPKQQPRFRLYFAQKYAETLTHATPPEGGIFISLGANLRNPPETFAWVLTQLPQSGISVVGASSLYVTQPWGITDQPDFFNQVVEVTAPCYTAHELLTVLQSLELQSGRVRQGLQWGPRVLDLDLLVYGYQHHGTPHLTLPHPRFPERAFVLGPWAELAPHYRPLAPDGDTVRTLWQRLPLAEQQGIRVLERV